MTYSAPLYRPPSEATSLIFQITHGCSHNGCTFCSMYKEKKFSIKSFKEIKNHIDEVADDPRMNKRIFLADGNALAVDTETLLKTLDYIKGKFSNIERIAIYAAPKDILKKSEKELKILGENGLKLYYMGIESGSDIVLKMVNKGVTPEEIVEAGQKIMNAGLQLSATIILGLGGKDLKKEHAIKTAQVTNKIAPTYLGALTLMVDPLAPIKNKIDAGEFKPLDSTEILEELEIMLEHFDMANTVFRSNHASNYLPLKGTLNRDRKKLLNLISQALNNPGSRLRPDYMRGF